MIWHFLQYPGHLLLPFLLVHQEQHLPLLRSDTDLPNKRKRLNITAGPNVPHVLFNLPNISTWDVHWSHPYLHKLVTKAAEQGPTQEYSLYCRWVSFPFQQPPASSSQGCFVLANTNIELLSTLQNLPVYTDVLLTRSYSSTKKLWLLLHKKLV